MAELGALTVKEDVLGAIRQIPDQPKLWTVLPQQGAVVTRLLCVSIVVREPLRHVVGGLREQLCAVIERDVCSPVPVGGQQLLDIKARDISRPAFSPQATMIA